MEEEQKNYKPVFITIQLSSETNKLLSESAARSHRKKLQEATIRALSRPYNANSDLKIKH